VHGVHTAVLLFFPFLFVRGPSIGIANLRCNDRKSACVLESAIFGELISAASILSLAGRNKECAARLSHVTMSARLVMQAGQRELPKRIELPDSPDQQLYFVETRTLAGEIGE
jgi:hypothetical protein